MSPRQPGRRGRSGAGSPARYPRAVRVNEVLREVIADALERMADADDRPLMLTVTAVQCDPDLRHATVLLASLGEEQKEAIAAMRVRLQAAVSREVRLKRTPLLSFAADPAVRSGAAIEEILRNLDRPAPSGVEGASSDEAGSTESP